MCLPSLEVKLCERITWSLLQAKICYFTWKWMTIDGNICCPLGNSMLETAFLHREINLRLKNEMI